MATLLNIFDGSKFAILGVNTSPLSGRFTHNFVHTGQGREININFGLPSFQVRHNENHDDFPTLGVRSGTSLVSLTRPSLGNRAGFGSVGKAGLSLSI